MSNDEMNVLEGVGDSFRASAAGGISRNPDFGWDIQRLDGLSEGPPLASGADSVCYNLAPKRLFIR